MWSMKLKVKVKDNPFTNYSELYNSRVFLYTHNYYAENKKYHFLVQGVVEKPKGFSSFVKKNEYVDYIKQNGVFFVCKYSFPEKSKRVPSIIAAFNTKFMFITPITYEGGWEWWEVAALKREDLTKLLDTCMKTGISETKLFHIKRYSPGSILVYEMFPKLTEKQEMAFRLAVDKNYYNYPRGITLSKLAELMKVSVSTYQFHLARAESKLMQVLRKKSDFSDKK